MNRDLLPYNGTWIACGSYALLNLLPDRDIGLIELESSTGAPFGIASYGDEFECMRMLTTFRDFNDGIDSAASLWGIGLEKMTASEPDEAATILEETDCERILVGPVSMIGLCYLPLSTQYRNMDHYFALLRISRGEFILMDSEGVPVLPVTLKEVAAMLTVKGIPEAKNLITMRLIRHAGASASVASRLEHTKKRAATNIVEAETMGQGSRAILRCAEVMSRVPAVRWRNSILYDLDYYIQRKLMLQYLLDQAGIGQLNKLIQSQIHRSGLIRKMVRERNFDGVEPWMEELAEDEQLLATRIEVIQ